MRCGRQRLKCPAWRADEMQIPWADKACYSLFLSGFNSIMAMQSQPAWAAHALKACLAWQALWLDMTMSLRHCSWTRSTRMPLRLAPPAHRQMPTSLRLRQSLPSTSRVKLVFWKLFCKTTWVLSWISDGYQIPWNEWGPPTPHAYATRNLLARKLPIFWPGGPLYRLIGHPL